MANITKRQNKSGQTSYLIRAYIDEGAGGKQITKSMTWHPPAGMRPSTADKQAEKEAVLFEKRVKSGVISQDGKTRFADYAARWMDTSDLAPKTREQYTHLLRRINQAIGHIPLEKLKVDHLHMFFKNLREDGVKSTGGYAISNNFDEYRKAAGLTQRKLCELSGVAVTTIVTAARGKRVSVETAKKLCAALEKPIETVFTVNAETGRLSDRTIKHHHTVIRAILASAKKARIIPHNVASEFMDAPKAPRTEARYMADDEAQAFLKALLKEPDIRIKTALILDLFTGIRRGELCGLSFSDIDYENKEIRIRKASQYVSGQGIIEVPTKNPSSDRDIAVTPFVLDALKEYHAWWIEYRSMYGDAWKGDKERLFIQADGKPIFPDTINGWLTKFAERNGLAHINPHALRHTFITLQITAGVDIRTLQARTGHAQASTLLNVYSHAIKSAQEKAAQAMDSVLLGAICATEKPAPHSP